MKNHLISFSILCFGFLLLSAGLPGRLQKAYNALAIYDYFQAKELFYKSLKNDPVAASYGLSIIYGRNDNPFTHIDSAHKYINISEQNWASVDAKSRIDYSVVGVDSLSILGQAYTVDSLAFLRAKAVNEISDWNEFIDNFDNAEFQALAIEKRNEILFQSAKAENTSEAYATFLTNFPNAEQKEEAEKLYDERNFEERTADNTLESYQSFIDSFPLSPYVPDAEERIFNLATAGGKAQDYLSFVELFISNPYTDIAWKRIYALEVKEITAQSIAEFTLNYPNYPFMPELKQQFELAVTRFYPITDGDYWGFINDKGEVAIAPKYEWVENFSDGIAMVGIGDEVTYIDKEEKEISKKRFSDGFAFNRGLAVVEKDDGYGIINRIGEFVVEPIYDDIGENSEGFFYVEKDGFFGYVNEAGENVIPFIYADAQDFHQGVAVVSDSSGAKGLINKVGNQITPFNYDWIESFTSIELPVRYRQNGSFGLLNRGGLNLTDSLYQALGEFSDGLILASSDDLYGFLNTKGDTVIDFLYSYSPAALTNSKFENGYAKVYQKDKVGVIDSTGFKVFPAIFEDIGTFTGNLIPVKKRGKWGYSDLDVNLALGYQYDYVSNFSDSLAIVSEDGLFGVIDTLGKTKTPLVFRSVEWIDTLLLVQDTAFGIISLTQDTLVPLQYDKISRIDKKVVQLKRFNGTYDYYDLSKKGFLRKEETLAE
ncbi:WG repeat-containing protein [Cryomorphaceae bacterium 1068]|nr:WG repeat-containing protein [Cryomorphaceae bacterium 1068]